MNWEFINRSFSYTDLSCLILLFSLGSIIGGFYYFAAMCVISEEGQRKGRIRYDNCGHKLTAINLILVLSFLPLKGRCRYCRRRLLYRFLLSKLFLGFVYDLTYFRFLKIDLSILCLLSLFGLLLVLSLVDFKSYIIPDWIIVAGIINRFIDPKLWLDLGYDLYRIFESLLLSGIVWLLAWIMNKINKKENFGGGDIKLVFAIGLYTGFYYGIWVLLWSCLIGLVYALRVKKRRIPFGPFLSVSTMFVLLYRGLI